MAGARSLAMALNRLIDAGIDAANPRTAGRELPSGALTLGAVVGFCARLARRLPRSRSGSSTRSSAGSGRSRSPRSSIYPYLKRFTWLCHFWLGAVDGLAPVGAWVAITGNLPWQAWALGGAVAAWVAGFDLFYSLFDVEIDRAQGLHSWAVRFGERGAFAGARLLHLATVALLIAAGVGLLGRLVVLGRGRRRSRRCSPTSTRSCAPNDLRRLDAAFFTMNGVISVAFFAFVLADVA